MLAILAYACMLVNGRISPARSVRRLGILTFLHHRRRTGPFRCSDHAKCLEQGAPSVAVFDGWAPRMQAQPVNVHNAVTQQRMGKRVAQHSAARMNESVPLCASLWGAMKTSYWDVSSVPECPRTHGLERSPQHLQLPRHHHAARTFSRTLESLPCEPARARRRMAFRSDPRLTAHARILRRSQTRGHQQRHGHYQQRVRPAHGLHGRPTRLGRRRPHAHSIF
jgi:hypothetical protein